METIRTFIDIPIKVEEKLYTVWENLRKQFDSKQVKWVNPDVLHLTLFFLGETPIKSVGKLQNALANEVKSFNQFSINLKGLGYFGQQTNPKVIWVGVEKNGALEELHRITNEVVSAFGFTPDERGFNPHITLGRPKHLANPSALIDFLKSENETLFQQSNANEIIHYKSELTTTGAIYHSLYKTPTLK
jgi:2'-5' RNA ligase